MPQLDYDDQVENNPWRPVRLVLFIIWAIHFFICAFTTVGAIAGLFKTTFDSHTAMGVISVTMIDALYIRQMHLYAMGQLEPLNATHMHMLQCVAVAWLMLELLITSLHDNFGIFIFLFCSIFASTFLIQLSVSFGVLYMCHRRSNRSPVACAQQQGLTGSSLTVGKGSSGKTDICAIAATWTPEIGFSLELVEIEKLLCILMAKKSGWHQLWE